MESKGSKFRCLKLYYDTFREEWISIRHKSFEPQCWDKFLESKDLGLKCISHAEDKYEVVDERKWFLAKIKYGI